MKKIYRNLKDNNLLNEDIARGFEEREDVLMLEGMNKRDMPYQKELIQAKLIKEILGSNVILLSRYATNTIDDTFGVTLQKGSLSDGLIALIDGDKYIEFKLMSPKGIIRNINEANESNVAFVASSSIPDSFPRKIEGYSNNLKVGNLEWICLLDEENRRYFEIKIVPSPTPTPQNVSEEYEFSAKKLVVSNPYPFDYNYIVDLAKVNPDSFIGLRYISFYK